MSDVDPGRWPGGKKNEQDKACRTDEHDCMSIIDSFRDGGSSMLPRAKRGSRDGRSACRRTKHRLSRRVRRLRLTNIPQTIQVGDAG